MSGPGRPVLTVVGIGADGLDGLTPASRRALESADSIHGSPRQLALVESLGVHVRPWPSPLLPSLPALVEEIAADGGVVLASGDPMFHGIGSTLARVLGPERLRVLPAPSSASLAAARMGWPLAGLAVHSCVTADPHVVLSDAAPGSRALVLCRDSSTPVELARVLDSAGAGRSRLIVLGELGGPGESRYVATATELAVSAAPLPDLCVVAVEVHVGGADHRLYGSRTPGLPDCAFRTDGQLTKRHLRAVTLSALAPRPGQLLWDVGGGSGSIAVEWMRAAAGARAVCVEQDQARVDRIRSNALALGTPGLDVVHGRAPDALGALPQPPDAVFVGGGLTAPGVVERCWKSLRPGGRFVAAAVTLESEGLLVDLHRRLGGTLTRMSVETAGPLGGFTGWRPGRSVVHLESVKSTAHSGDPS